MLDNSQLALLELLKTSLFEIEPVFPDSVDWDAVLVEAKAQTVVALAAKVVPDEYESRWKPYASQSQAQFIRVLHGQTQLVKLLKQDGIPLVILKGTAAAMYYPEPYRRMMGDVDFLVPQNMFNDAARLLEADGYRPFHELQKQLDSPSCPRHIEFGKDGIEYELHHHFSVNGIDFENTLISGLEYIETAEIGGVSFPALPAMENGLVLLAHTAAHLRSSELGLRQVIDWMMFVHRELDDEKWKNCFCEMAEQAGLRKLAIALTRLCRDHLGLPGEYRWYEEANEQVVSELLDLIFESGNFGRKRSGLQTVENYAIEIRTKGFFSFMKLISGVVWHSSRVQNSVIFLRPLIWSSEFFRRLRKRISERPNHLLEDMNRSSEVVKLYKELEIR